MINFSVKNGGFGYKLPPQTQNKSKIDNNFQFIMNNEEWEDYAIKTVKKSKITNKEPLKTTLKHLVSRKIFNL